MGLAVDDETPVMWTVRAEDEERLVVEMAWSFIEEASRIVTFNGSFDLRFLAVRSMVNRIAPPPVGEDRRALSRGRGIDAGTLQVCRASL